MGGSRTIPVTSTRSDSGSSPTLSSGSHTRYGPDNYCVYVEVPLQSVSGDYEDFLLVPIANRWDRKILLKKNIKIPNNCRGIRGRKPKPGNAKFKTR